MKNLVLSSSTLATILRCYQSQQLVNSSTETVQVAVQSVVLKNLLPVYDGNLYLLWTRETYECCEIRVFRDTSVAATSVVRFE